MACHNPLEGHGLVLRAGSTADCAHPLGLTVSQGWLGDQQPGLTCPVHPVTH